MSIRAALLAIVLASPGFARAQFSYRPPGELVTGSGAGRVDDRVYAPGILFPIRDAPAFANSQVWGVGGSSGPGGSQCDARNYSFPWHDNYCETRSWSMPLCPSGTGHQGQDIRGPSCMAEVNPVVAVTDGMITNVGSYSVYLTAADGTRFDYLHMRPVTVSVGDRVARGDIVGYVANEFGGTPTTIHLHFNIRQNVSGVGSVYVPPYMSLVRAYETLTGAGTPRFAARYVAQTFPLARDPFELAPGAESAGYLEMRNVGTETWTVGSTFLGTTQPRDVASPLAGPDWPSDHRAASIDHDVAPGETGRFAFTVRAPLVAGDYPQYFSLVEEGVSWFGDDGGPPDDQIQIRVTVVGTDADGDGSLAGADCDDADAGVHPGAAETCGDAIDQDCDGTDAPCGSIDGGAGNDGGSTARDAGVERPVSGSCSCRAGGPREAPMGLAILALAIALALRRARFRKRG